MDDIDRMIRAAIDPEVGRAVLATKGAAVEAMGDIVVLLNSRIKLAEEALETARQAPRSISREVAIARAEGALDACLALAAQVLTRVVAYQREQA